MLEIVAVPAFADNYIWLVHDPDSGETALPEVRTAVCMGAPAARPVGAHGRTAQTR